MPLVSVSAANLCPVLQAGELTTTLRTLHLALRKGTCVLVSSDVDVLVVLLKVDEFAKTQKDPPLVIISLPFHWARKMMAFKLVVKNRSLLGCTFLTFPL